MISITPEEASFTKGKISFNEFQRVSIINAKIDVQIAKEQGFSSENIANIEQDLQLRHLSVFVNNNDKQIRIDLAKSQSEIGLKQQATYHLRKAKVKPEQLQDHNINPNNVGLKENVNGSGVQRRSPEWREKELWQGNNNNAVKDLKGRPRSELSAEDEYFLSKYYFQEKQFEECSGIRQIVIEQTKRTPGAGH